MWTTAANVFVLVMGGIIALTSIALVPFEIVDPIRKTIACGFTMKEAISTYRNKIVLFAVEIVGSLALSVSAFTALLH